MENRLRNLYVLQNIDKELSEIHEQKGDLPEIVATLGTKIEEMNKKMKELNDFIKKSKMDRDNIDIDILNLAEKIEKYKSQQLQVKSNKQYDALSREIEAAEDKTSKLEKEMEQLEGKIQLAKKDLETLSKQLTDLNEEFEDRERELKEVNKEHEKEELELKHKRDKVVAKIDKATLDKYERIRKAKGGIAVVAVKRNACGGCYSRIPPQKILELKQNSKMITCEHCGRILVSDQIVATSSL